MIVECLTVGSFGSNCWIVGCEETQEGLVIDPGDEGTRILAQVEALGLTIRALILTHGHLDHVGAAGEVRAQWKCEVLIHEADGELLESVPEQASLFGLRTDEAPPADRYLQEGDSIPFGNHALTVIETPGHSPGGICLKTDDSPPLLFAGDTLFQRSVGRTDLWGGSYSQLMRSIREKLFPLPDETVVCPGHGPRTTLGDEKRHNPFLTER